MSAATMVTCPNESCEASNEVTVRQTAPYQPARLVSWENSSPEWPAEYEVDGLEVPCTACGTDLDTPALYADAIARLAVELARGQD